MTAWGTLCADKFKTLLKVNTSAAVLGLGYIIGLKYSAIIAAGSFLIWLLVVPVVGSTATGAGMSPEELYQTFGRPLGIGGIAMAAAMDQGAMETMEHNYLEPVADAILAHEQG